MEAQSCLEQMKSYPSDSFEAQGRLHEIGAYFDSGFSVQEVSQFFGLNPLIVSMLLNNPGSSVVQ